MRCGEAHLLRTQVGRRQRLDPTVSAAARFDEQSCGDSAAEGAGTHPDGSDPGVVGDALDGFIGSWSKEQEVQLLQSIRATEQIERAFWPTRWSMERI